MTRHRSIDGRAPSGIPAMFFASNGNGSREESNGSCSNGSMGSPVEHRAVPMKSHKRDARLIGIRAADWGVDYVNDDDFADIITSYFTWDHPHSRLFDEDLFLEGLQNPRTEFCSSLLVNAILAIATVSADMDGKVSTKLMASCRRLVPRWDRQSPWPQAKRHQPTLQGCGISIRATTTSQASLPASCCSPRCIKTVAVSGVD